MPRKRITFEGRSWDDLQSFPTPVRDRIDAQLRLLERGLDPDDWKPMAAVGPGVREIRVRDRSGAFRAIYVAKFEEAVFVLHCFQKKSEQTSRHDIEVARKRYRDLRARR